MDAVFLLWHSHHTGDGETNDKLIGVYSSEAEAEAAKMRKLQYEGFRETMALLSGTLMLSIVGPFAILWLTIAADRAMDWFGATARLIS